MFSSKNFIQYFAAIAILIFLASCSITKKQYSSGYHIEWKTSQLAKREKAFQQSKIDSVTTVKTEVAESTIVADSVITYSEVLSAEVGNDEATISAAIVQSKIEKAKLFLPVKTVSKRQGTSINGFSLASLVLGIITFIIPILGIVTGIIGIILGLVALSQIKNNPELYDRSDKTLATIGLVLSIVGVILNLALLFIYIMFINALGAAAI